MVTTRRNGEGRARDGRAGFSLVEVIVALVILAVGLLGLAATTGWVVRQTTLSEVTTDRGAALQSAVERIKATPFNNLADGSMTLGRFDVSWTVTATSQFVRDVEIVTEGPGLTSAGGGLPRLTTSVADTFNYRIVQ